LRDELELRDKALWEKLENIEKRLDKAEPTSSEIIVIEEMSKGDAKQKVLEFIKEHKTSDIAELHKKIRCDISQLVEIMDELIREGKIEEGV